MRGGRGRFNEAVRTSAGRRQLQELGHKIVELEVVRHITARRQARLVRPRKISFGQAGPSGPVDKVMAVVLVPRLCGRSTDSPEKQTENHEVQG